MKTIAFIHSDPWRKQPGDAVFQHALRVLRQGHRVAWISAPVNPWPCYRVRGRESVARQLKRFGACGSWLHQRLFVFTPRTYLPVHTRWPMNSNAAFNGSEFFTRPRAGEILRENGFDRVDLLVLSNFEMVHLVRQLQPRRFLIYLEDALPPTSPRAVLRMLGQVVADADGVIAGNVAAESQLRPHARRLISLSSAKGLVSAINELTEAAANE